MAQLGAVTFRYHNGFDLVPTLPPELPGMSEPFRQLPAEATLWRTIGGACLKATGGLLVDCPGGAAVEAAEAAAAAAGLAVGEGSEEEETEEAASSSKPDVQRKKQRKERCSYSLGDHRLMKYLGALGRCVMAQAKAEGDQCMPQVLEAILPKKVAAEVAR